MAISTATYILIGSGTADETVTLASVVNNATSAGSTVDVLGDDTSAGDVELFAILTSTVTAGSVQIRVNPQRRLNGGTADYVKVGYDYSISPINGTQKIPLGRRSCPRHLSADSFNNATGASCTLAILAKVTKYS